MRGNRNFFVMKPEYFKSLVSAYLDGVLSPDQKAELEDLMRGSQEHRAEFWRLSQFHEQLRSAGETEDFWKTADSGMSDQLESVFWLGWFRNPVAAAIGGFVLCLISTSSLRAYVNRSWAGVRPLPLMNGGFEARDRIGSGSPYAVGVWSGDFSRICGPENGVLPFEGKKMLRILRADNVRSEPGGTHNLGQVLQVIDLRPFRKELKGGGAEVVLSARFASAVYDPRFQFFLRAVSFSGPMDFDQFSWNFSIFWGENDSRHTFQYTFVECRIVISRFF